MNIAEFQIQLDLNANNEKAVIEEYCCQIDYNSWLFVSSDDGKCWLFDSNGKMLDIKKKLRHLRDGLFFFNTDDLKRIVIPDSVTSIGKWTFSTCSELMSVTIPDSVTRIGQEAFYHCTSLTNVTIPNSVPSIKYAMFAYCSKLACVMIGNGVASIDEGAFNGCSRLTSMMIPDSVTRIEWRVFEGCSRLATITVMGKTTAEAKSLLADASVPEGCTIVGELG